MFANNSYYYIVAVAETWLNSYKNTENNFLRYSHTFFGKCRSDQTGALMGGGVGILIPKRLTPVLH